MAQIRWVAGLDAVEVAKVGKEQKGLDGDQGRLGWVVGHRGGIGKSGNEGPLAGTGLEAGVGVGTGKVVDQHIEGLEGDQGAPALSKEADLGVELV